MVTPRSDCTCAIYWLEQVVAHRSCASCVLDRLRLLRIAVTSGGRVAAVDLEHERGSPSPERRARLADRRAKMRVDDLGRESPSPARRAAGRRRSSPRARHSPSRAPRCVSPLSIARRARATLLRAGAARFRRRATRCATCVLDLVEGALAGGLDAGHVEPDIAAVARAQRLRCRRRYRRRRSRAAASRASGRSTTGRRSCRGRSDRSPGRRRRRSRSASRCRRAAAPGCARSSISSCNSCDRALARGDSAMLALHLGRPPPRRARRSRARSA